MSDDNLKLLLVLIPALPLAAAILTGIFGKRVLGHSAHLPALVAMPSAFVLSLALLLQVAGKVDSHHGDEAHAADATHAAQGHAVEPAASADPGKSIGYEQVYTLWTWADIPDAIRLGGKYASGAGPRSFSIDVSLRCDPLTCIMLAMVTFVSSLVVIYSIGYMHDDPGYWRFFSYVSLFVFSMTMLVSVSNFALLYVFWEAVGVCSYLLIGFWFQKPEAAAAGKKAFLVNRIGDFGFALGIFLIWTTYGTLNFHDTGAAGSPEFVSGVLGQSRLMHGTEGYVAGGVGLAICLLLFLGACGKSAQFPLHTWLPDAMEGPTPVSALIHAATMVTAGVYMVARCTPLFFVAPDAQQVVAFIGAFTALLAGLIALTQNDLKRVLAYSTVSQLGYMFLALGTGSLLGVTAGMFHLFTHAFFKALLFLGAGSVMHAMGGVIDMRRFGGLRHVMPYTHWTFLIGCLALAGVFPWAGFWSKDMILSAVKLRSDAGTDGSELYFVLYCAGVFTAFLTAFYTFRAFYMTFYGEKEIPAEAGHHAHESPATMTAPLVILAICATVVGAYFEWTHGFAHMLGQTPSLAYQPIQATIHPGEFHFDVAAMSTVVALAGIGLAAYLYLGDRRAVRGVGRLMRPLYELSYGKFFIDELYNAIFVFPLRVLATISYFLDRVLIDGLVNLVGNLPRGFGWLFRSLQTGMVQFYALAMVLGLLVLAGTLLMWPGP